MKYIDNSILPGLKLNATSSVALRTSRFHHIVLILVTDHVSQSHIHILPEKSKLNILRSPPFYFTEIYLSTFLGTELYPC